MLKRFSEWSSFMCKTYGAIRFGNTVKSSSVANYLEIMLHDPWPKESNPIQKVQSFTYFPKKLTAKVGNIVSSAHSKSAYK